jgi:hypothetical protein
MTEGALEADVPGLLTVDASPAGLSTVAEGWVPAAGGLP